MDLIGIGRTAEVFVTDDGKALKLYFDEVSSDQAKYEAKISECVAQVFLDAPVFYGLQETEGRLGLLFERIQGKMLSDVIIRNPWKTRQYAQMMGGLHRRIHAVKVNTPRTAEEVYGHRIKSYVGLPDDIKGELLGFIEQQAASATLCHGDLHPDNIMLDEHDHMQVVDWINAYSGEPMSDVARTYYLIGKGLSPQKMSRLEKMVVSIIRFFLSREYIKSYYKDIAFSRKEFDTWLLIILVARYDEGIQEEKQQLDKLIARAIARYRARLLKG